MNDESTLIGRTLADRYRVESEIARGGMASVYRARDLRLDRDVAMKVLASPYADDPRFTARFLDEARAAASLSHPSLVHVYDSGSDGRAHYIVMELLDRHRTLRDVLDSEGPRPADEVLRIGRELLAGLRVVHEHGLVHCDVKPANVMLGPGPAKLIDFGIATPAARRLPMATRASARCASCRPSSCMARRSRRPAICSASAPSSTSRSPGGLRIRGRHARGGQRGTCRRTGQAALDDRRRHSRPAGRGDSPGAAPRS